MLCNFKAKPRPETFRFNFTTPAKMKVAAVIIAFATSALAVTLNIDTASVKGNETSDPMRSYFVGLSIEWNQVETVLLKGAVPTTLAQATASLNKDFVSLVKNFGIATRDNTTHPSMILRVGGNSAAHSYVAGSKLNQKIN